MAWRILFATGKNNCMVDLASFLHSFDSLACTDVVCFIGVFILAQHLVRCVQAASRFRFLGRARL